MGTRAAPPRSESRRAAGVRRHAAATLPDAAAESARWAPLSRHLEGWQPAALAVFLAGSAALVAVPRAVDPVEVPEPALDAAALSRVAAVDRELYREATAGLDADVRALGSAIRAYGRADAGDEVPVGDAVRARERAVEAFRVALGIDPQQVLRLRAYQMGSFVREVHRWVASGTETEELREVGGGFLRTARRNAWVHVDHAGGRRRLYAGDAALSALFKKRWNEIVGMSGTSFDLAVDEQRALYAFLLDYPAVPAAPPELADAAPGELPAALAIVRTRREHYRLKKIDELAALDPGYPADLARGVVLFRMGRYPHAVEKLRAHLERNPDGPFALRAQNHLRAALERAAD